MDIFNMNEMTELLPGIMQIAIILAVIYHIIYLLQHEQTPPVFNKQEETNEYTPKHMK